MYSLTAKLLHGGEGGADLDLRLDLVGTPFEPLHAAEEHCCAKRR